MPDWQQKRGNKMYVCVYTSKKVHGYCKDCNRHDCTITIKEFNELYGA